MLVKEFVEKYKTLNNPDLKQNLIKGIIEKTYIPILVKNAYATEAVNKSSVKGSDSIGLYLLYIMSILKLYTNLEVDSKTFNEDYDILQEYGLVDKIIAEIGPDLKEFQTVYNMRRDDYEKNNYTIAALINKLIDSINNVGEQVLEHPDLKKIIEIYRKQLS